MANRSTTMIEVDTEAAEILRRATERARALGETLGDYLRHALPPEQDLAAGTQLEAWEAFVRGMADWAATHLPAGYVADDSRESMHDGRG